VPVDVFVVMGVSVDVFVLIVVPAGVFVVMVVSVDVNVGLACGALLRRLFLFLHHRMGVVGVVRHTDHRLKSADGHRVTGPTISGNRDAGVALFLLLRHWTGRQRRGGKECLNEVLRELVDYDHTPSNRDAAIVAFPHLGRHCDQSNGSVRYDSESIALKVERFTRVSEEGITTNLVIRPGGRYGMLSSARIIAFQVIIAFF